MTKKSPQLTVVEGAGQAVAEHKPTLPEYAKADAAIAELKKQYGATVWEVRSPEAMKLAREARAHVREYRYDVEKTRTQLKKDVLERGRTIDGEAKRITGELEKIELPIDEAIKAEEKRVEDERRAKEKVEEQRVAKHRAAIDGVRRQVFVLGRANSNEIATALAQLEDFAAIPDDFEEFQAEAEAAMAETLATLKVMHKNAVATEEEQRRLKAEAAELDRKRAAVAAEEQASRDRIAADEKASRDARAIEDQRLQVERDKLDADKRAADEAKRKADADADNKRRAEERERAEYADAVELLQTFKRRFGTKTRFKPIISAIDLFLIGPGEA